LLLLAPAAGAADFAEPPDREPQIARSPDDEPYYDQPHSHYHHDGYVEPLPRSTVRLFTGPALRISQDSPDGGLFAALDIGERAAGLRLSGAWVRVGAERGLSQYAGELWIDFGHDQRLHPILGAGAGAARLDRENPNTNSVEAETVGIGVLRGSLQYMLPVGGTDARASIDVMGAVPAIKSEAAQNVGPWMLALATVGVGF
jgi:hypothetical protein